jgi:CarD family transcriptional regulator
MAQKTASSRTGAKKANKKPASRKHPAAAAKVAKPKRKVVLAKARPKAAPKAARKVAPAKVAPAKVAPAKVAPAKVAPAKQAKPAASAAKAAVIKRPAPPQGAPAAAAAKPHVPAAKAIAAMKQAVAARPATPAAARSIPAAVAKTASQTIIAPPSGQHSAAAKIAPPAPKKPVHQRHGFKVSEWIVYPAHGVGRIVAIEEQEIAGISLELFVITFEKDKMTLRVPTGKSQSVGMRKLADEDTVKKAMETLKGRARVKRTMWSRRAQEYEAKINSGDLISIAEVVRDLYRSESQPEQSYSERQLYEAALDRMAREIAAVEKLDERGATQRITEVLAKSARGRRLAAEDAETKAA